MEDKRDAIKNIVQDADNKNRVMPASGIKMQSSARGGFYVDGMHTTSDGCSEYLKVMEIEALCRLAEAQERIAAAQEKLVELEQKKAEEKETEEKVELPKSQRTLEDSWLGGV
jgi:hypothetical protein